MGNPENIIAVIYFISSIIPVFLILKIFYFYKITIKAWHFTIGLIVEYETVPVDDGGWKKKVVYNYIVNGITYQSDSVTKNIKLLSSFKKQVDYENKYDVGNEITVYYNPIKPQDCILVTSFNYNNIYILFFTIVLAFAAHISWQ